MAAVVRAHHISNAAGLGFHLRVVQKPRGCDELAPKKEVRCGIQIVGQSEGLIDTEPSLCSRDAVLVTVTWLTPNNLARSVTRQIPRWAMI